MPFEPCDCGSQRPLTGCCGPYLAGEALAPTAEALMRSRYSAFCRGNVDYLIATHRWQQPADERSNLSKSVKSTRWINLLIVGTQKGKAKDTTGVVEFVAAYRPVRLLTELSLGMTATDDLVRDTVQLHERSQFVKEGDRWFYTVGDILPAYKPTRSQPCWCGSGKKFKQCHG
jgi:SEC-C motif domain protein